MHGSSQTGPKPITIDAHTVVNAPEPATTLQHLNNLDACSPYQTPDVTRCVQVHFDAEFYPSSEDDVSSRPAKSLTPSPVATPESPFHSSRADAEIKFQVRQLLLEDHSPIILNSLRVDCISLRLSVFPLALAPHWQTRHETSPEPPRGPEHNPFAGATPSPLDCRGRRNSPPPSR